MIFTCFIKSEQVVLYRNAGRFVPQSALPEAHAFALSSQGDVTGVRMAFPFRIAIYN